MSVPPAITTIYGNGIAVGNVIRAYGAIFQHNNYFTFYGQSLADWNPSQVGIGAEGGGVGFTHGDPISPQHCALAIPIKAMPVLLTELLRTLYRCSLQYDSRIARASSRHCMNALNGCKGWAL